MLLSSLQKNKKSIIKKINADDELKQRLSSFGVTVGSEVEVVECSLGKNTIKIVCEETAIALRLEEAKKIEVE